MKEIVNRIIRRKRAFPAERLARRLHDKLGQHLVGVTLATSALTHKLNGRHAPEVREAREIVKHLRSACREVGRLIDWLDQGVPR